MNFPSLTLLPSTTSGAIETNSRNGSSTLGIAPPRCRFLTRALAREDRLGCREQNPQVRGQRTCPGVAQVQPDHLVEGRPAAPEHLPQAGHSRLGIAHPAPMPPLVLRNLVGKGRARSN